MASGSQSVRQSSPCLCRRVVNVQTASVSCGGLGLGLGLGAGAGRQKISREQHSGLAQWDGTTEVRIGDFAASQYACPAPY